MRFDLVLWSSVSAGGGTGDEDPARAGFRVTIGRYHPGPWNAITDVEGVMVGHATLIEGDGVLVPGKGPVRTGVTVIIPRENVWKQKAPAGAYMLNGTGEMTGLA